MNQILTSHPDILMIDGNIKIANHDQMSVIKRDGKQVSYDHGKIFHAVEKCLISCQKPTAEVVSVATQVTDQVDHILRLKSFKDQKDIIPINIEIIQNIVEIQLMALGYYDAAKHYILYRDERRRDREDSKKISPELRQLFKEGCSYFKGINYLTQQVQHFDKFSRFDWIKRRREVWPETVDRVMSYFKNHAQRKFPGIVPEEKWSELKQSLSEDQATPSMRSLQMAGPALERCQSGVFNCSYLEMDSPESLSEDLYLLMQGCGVGFSVEEDIVDKWPRVKKQRGLRPVNYVVEDYTESWCTFLKDGLNILLDGGDVIPDVSRVRPKDAILRTKGGRASGPQVLVDLWNFSRDVVLSRQGKKLRTLDVHDIVCMTHRIGQMGGVRRASGLSVSSRDDILMRHAKDGNFLEKHFYRNQANNAACYEEKPTAVEFMEEWLSLSKSGSGERSVFNRGSLHYQIPLRREIRKFGTNPCGEVILRHKQFCNLSIAIVNQKETVEELKRKIRLATLWGTMQTTMTKFEYISPDWKMNTEEENLLGVDILGHMDCDLLKPGVSGREELLRTLLGECRSENMYWSNLFKINFSSALTCGKPSGDSSVRFDKPAGLKEHHGRFYIRRLRFTNSGPIAKVLKDSGIPWEPEYDNSGNSVFEFPCRSPDNTIILGERTAIDQLENWKVWKVNFTEHNPSVSIYVKETEWFAVGNWVYENWDIVGGISFFPYDGGIYPQTPYQTITQEEYNQRMLTMPTEIDWARIVLYEESDQTELAGNFACTAPGGCDI